MYLVFIYAGKQKQKQYEVLCLKTFGLHRIACGELPAVAGRAALRRRRSKHGVCVVVGEVSENMKHPHIYVKTKRQRNHAYKRIKPFRYKMPHAEVSPHFLALTGDLQAVQFYGRAFVFQTRAPSRGSSAPQTVLASLIEIGFPSCLWHPETGLS